MSTPMLISLMQGPMQGLDDEPILVAIVRNHLENNKKVLIARHGYPVEPITCILRLSTRDSVWDPERMVSISMPVRATEHYSITRASGRSEMLTAGQFENSIKLVKQPEFYVLRIPEVA